MIQKTNEELKKIRGQSMQRKKKTSQKKRTKKKSKKNEPERKLNTIYNKYKLL